MNSTMSCFRALLLLGMVTAANANTIEDTTLGQTLTVDENGVLTVLPLNNSSLADDATDVSIQKAGAQSQQPQAQQSAQPDSIRKKHRRSYGVVYKLKKDSELNRRFKQGRHSRRDREREVEQSFRRHGASKTRSLNHC